MLSDETKVYLPLACRNSTPIQRLCMKLNSNVVL